MMTPTAPPRPRSCACRAGSPASRPAAIDHLAGASGFSLEFDHVADLPRKGRPNHCGGFSDLGRSPPV